MIYEERSTQRGAEVMDMKKYLVLESWGGFKVVDGDDYESTYKVLSQNVDGCIECVSWIKPFAERGIDLWINDEGKLLDLEPSLVVKDKGEFVELLCGNIVFARNNEYGDTLPLNDEDIEFIKSALRKELANIRFSNPYTNTTLYNLIPVIEL